LLNWKEIFTYSADSPLIFSGYLFLFLFTVAFAVFTIIHKNTKWRNIFLFAFSLFFYYKSGGIYFWILIFSTLVDYYLGGAIYRAPTRARKKLFLIISLVSNLGTLAFFKYAFYLVTVINESFGTDLHAINLLAVFANGIFGSDFNTLEIILPVGISFYTFQTLSYSIDIFRGQLKPAKNIIDFGFFVTFFPQLVAGPIVRASEFLPQIHKKYHLTKAQLGTAVFLIMNGMFKKMVVSDYISVNFVDRVFNDPQLYNGFDNLMAVYGYSIQIYCDFSGYSDMAIGLAALLGFTLPINFRSPYKATSITDFWRRWHISLSSWLRDYLYISLGGNRKGKIRTYVNLFITMLIGGLWHGRATSFIIWGGLHGLALAAHKVWARYVPWAKSESKLYKLVMGLVTFHFVAYCWIYFRAKSMDKVNQIINQIAYNFQWSEIPIHLFEYRWVFGIIVMGFVFHWLPESWKQWARNMYTAIPDVAKAFVFALAIFIAYQAQSADIQPFIYFAF
jgi:alginate O-acetyltransferase complex protein AlgI